MALSFLHALHMLPFEEWFIQIYLRDKKMCAPEEQDTTGGSFANADAFNATEIELAHNITIVCEQVSPEMFCIIELKSCRL